MLHRLFQSFAPNQSSKLAQTVSWGKLHSRWGARSAYNATNVVSKDLRRLVGRRQRNHGNLARPRFANGARLAPVSEVRDQLQALFGSSLTVRSMEELESSARLLKFRKDARLFASGNAAEHFITVTSGRAKVQLSSRAGRETVLFRLGPGQCCALTASSILTNSPYYAEGIAETDLEVVVIGSAAFNAALTSSPNLMRTLLTELAERISGLTMLVDRQIGRDLNSELMDFLLERADPDHKIELSHKKIAEELGTVREVVSRKLKDLEKVGRIKIGRGSVRLLKD